MGQANNLKVRGIARKFFEARNTRDLETLSGLVAPSLTVNNPWYGRGEEN